MLKKLSILLFSISLLNASVSVIPYQRPGNGLIIPMCKNKSGNWDIYSGKVGQHNPDSAAIYHFDQAMQWSRKGMHEKVINWKGRLRRIYDINNGQHRHIIYLLPVDVDTDRLNANHVGCFGHTYDQCADVYLLDLLRAIKNKRALQETNGMFLNGNIEPDLIRMLADRNLRKILRIENRRLKT